MNNTFSVISIINLKNAFITYNIARLRELIRYLPAKKLALFRYIPFWLHVNLPGIPGYVDSPDTPYGIYNFHNSGLWREVVERLKGKEKDLIERQIRKEYVQGMYLMGSSGTLAQTEKSDFDYWIVVDAENVNAESRALFQEKLIRIESWSRERYDQEVRLFELRLADVRANEFSGVDEDSSGSAQQSLLKEEFYRTFIMVAGKIPYWVAMPSGLSNTEYGEWIQQAAGAKSLKFIHQDYIDLGNIETINRQECLGAILWQLFKARKYPAKSLLKAGLVAHYFFSMEKDGLLCEHIRAGFVGSTFENLLFDPYAVVFKTVVDFFRSIADEEGLILTQECIFLRLSEESKTGQSTEYRPKQELLNRYLSQWGWGEAKVRKMAAYPTWPELDRLAFEARIYNKIGFLYELIRKGHDGAPDVFMKPSDLLLLKNRISAALKKKPGKLPACSAFLRTHSAAFIFQVCGHKDDAGRECWRVYNQSGKALDPRHLVFQGPELLRTLGWLLANGFYPSDTQHIHFQTFELPLPPRRVEVFFEEVARFFLNVTSGQDRLQVSPEWERMVVFPRVFPNSTAGHLAGADFLAVNSWGEFFYESVDLTFTKNISSQCAIISEIIWKYSDKTSGRPPSYFLTQLGKHLDAAIPGMVESGLAAYIETISPTRQVNFDAPEADMEKEDEPLLDLL